MNTTKNGHTLGPWTQNGRFIYADPGQDGNECEVARCGMADSPRNDADARLISAAPELLLILQRAVAQHQIRCDVAKRLGVTPPIKEAWVVDARAAIAKATGTP